ncbi:MAG: recombinase family protein [Bradyrhizobium sp.]|nr:recombinase family protein [Bradyrhizobium sp.]
MANALVVQKGRLPQSQLMKRAAQYVRMSTDHQKYSIENQAAAIAAYAQANGLTIVYTYRDEGISGLRIKNRMGLTQLIDDVRSGHADFGHVLVYDVSRWGRFQDIDESAHYEFTCKQAGIKVSYCAEQFDNDGGIISSIIKNIKRAMAAEYSRELSVKVHAAGSRMVRLGFKMGGQVGFGLERFAIDGDSKEKGVLKPGECKYLKTDRVRLRPGTSSETEVVRWIFDQFVKGTSQVNIVRELNRRGIPMANGRPWNGSVMSVLLRNEAYIGNLVWNRHSCKLGSRKVKNHSDLWIRTERCYEPTIDEDLFLRAKKKLDVLRLLISEEEMLARLRKFLAKKGSLTVTIIDSTPGLPATSTLKKHFGSIQNVYRLIGYNKTRYWSDLQGHQRSLALSRRNGEHVYETLASRGMPGTFDPALSCLRLSNNANICFGVAKWRNYKGRFIRWTLHRRLNWPPGWVVAVRFGTNNAEIQDYLLLPSRASSVRWLWLSEENLKNYAVEVFGTLEELTESLIDRIQRLESSRKAGRHRSKALPPRHDTRRRSRAGC